MKKFTIVIGIIAVVGVLIALSGLIVYGFDFVALGADFRGSRHYESHAIILDDNALPSTLNIDVRGHNVVIRAGEEFGVNLYIHTTRTELDYNFTEYGGEVSFNIKVRRNFQVELFSFTPARYNTINIIIPNEFYGDVNLESRSGNVDISGINIGGGNIDIDSRSGNVRITNTTAEEFKINSQSGNVRVNNSNGIEFLIEVTSGNVNLNNVKGNEIIVETRSGNVNLNNVEFTIIRTDVRSGNATIRLIGNQADYRVELSQRSGNSFLNGRRVSQGVLSNGTEGSVRMISRSGNNRITFV